MYPRLWSSDVAYLHSSSVGIGSFVVSLICYLCTITVGVLLLYFSCYVSVRPWCICTSTCSAFISASFSASTRAEIPCFPGTTRTRLIATSWHRLDSCSTIIWINPNALHSSCILIGIQQPSEELFPPINIPKVLLQNFSCRPDTEIYGPGPSSKYTGCPNIFYALGLMNLSTMAPLVFPRALSTVVANYVSSLFIINTSGGFHYQISLYAPWGNQFWCQIH